MARPQHSIDEVEATRRRLVELALELALREGMEALSFRRLAERAGISHTLPYRYFESKESLLVALRIECTRRFDEFVRAREEPSSAGLERVRGIASSYIAFVRQHPGEYQIIFAMQPPAPDAYPELLAARQQLFEHAVEALQSAVERGELQGNPRQLAHLFWVSLHGLMTLHVAGQLVHGLELDDLAEPLVDRMISAAGYAPPRLRHPSISPVRRVRR